MLMRTGGPLAPLSSGAVITVNSCSSRSDDWLKMENPNALAAKREVSPVVPRHLKLDRAIDDQSSQDNEKHNRGCERAPVVFGTPWVRPPTIVARPRSAFKVSICHA